RPLRNTGRARGRDELVAHAVHRRWVLDVVRRRAVRTQLLDRRRLVAAMPVRHEARAMASAPEPEDVQDGDWPEAIARADRDRRLVALRERGDLRWVRLLDGRLEMDARAGRRDRAGRDQRRLLEEARPAVQRGLV